MSIPTEPHWQRSSSPELDRRAVHFGVGKVSAQELGKIQDEAVRETVRLFEATGSPIITDGEQAKPSFATYPLAGLTNLAPDGAVIPFADGHTRQLPRITRGPFRYATHAASYLAKAKPLAHRPVKQAVISASALGLLYPQGGIDGYPRETFLKELVDEAAADIRGCLDGGAHAVQVDFTEGRLSVKLDPSKGLLKGFVELEHFHTKFGDRQADPPRPGAASPIWSIRTS